MTFRIASMLPAPRVAIGDYARPLDVDQASLTPQRLKQFAIEESSAANPIRSGVYTQNNYSRFRSTANEGLHWSTPSPQLEITPIPHGIRPPEDFIGNVIMAGFMVGETSFTVSSHCVVQTHEIAKIDFPEAEVDWTQRAQVMIANAIVALGDVSKKVLSAKCGFSTNSVSTMYSRGYFPKTLSGGFAPVDPRYQKLARILGLNEKEFCAVIKRAQSPVNEQSLLSLPHIKALLQMDKAKLNPTQRAQRLILDAMQAKGVSSIYALSKISDFPWKVISRMFSKGYFPATQDRKLASRDPRYKSLAQALDLDEVEFYAAIEKVQYQDKYFDKLPLHKMDEAELNPKQRAQKMMIDAMAAVGIRSQTELAKLSKFKFHPVQIGRMVNHGHFPTRKNLKPASKDSRYKALARILGLDEKEFCAAIEKTQRPAHEIIEERKRTRLAGMKKK